MSYPLVSYAKCSTLRAVKNFEDGAERLDKVLDRVAARMEARCNGVVDAIDRAITGLEQRAVKSSFLQPATSLTPAMTRNKLVNQRQAAARKNALRQHIIHQQKLNQGRAEAALKRTHAAKSAASVFSQAVAMKRASPSSAQQQQQRNNMVQQRTKSKEVTVARPERSTPGARRRRALCAACTERTARRARRISTLRRLRLTLRKQRRRWSRKSRGARV